MPARITASHTEPCNVYDRLHGSVCVTPGVAVEVECDLATITDALDALDRAVADVKAQLADAAPMRVITSATAPVQDTPRT